MMHNKPAEPCVFVIFGVAGDLTKRLLLPAICNLGSGGLLAENFCIVGVAIEPFTTESFRLEAAKDIKQFVTDPAAQEFGLKLLDHIYYVAGDFADLDVYVRLKKQLAELETQQASKNCLFYFATPPAFINTIVKALSETQLLSEEEGSFHRRIIIEKPFGSDFDSAKKLNQELLAAATEEQLFRIDHYLGKETVQNILAFRFANGIFEPIWNRRYIDHIQITVAETLGVELRGGYYEHAGALRDMLPNHLLQVLSFIAMEPPASFSADAINDEKEKVLHSIQRFTPQQVLQYAVRGQYGPGEVNSVAVPGYRSEKNVAPQSNTETFVALKLLIDNWRWLDVPFYVRTGKCLARRTTEVVIQFNSPPSTLFRDTAQKKLSPNLLRIHIQPQEGISLSFGAKIPGPTMQLGDVDMNFNYNDYFGVKYQTGYETLLYECMNGEHTLFARANMVESGWAIVQPMLDVWGALTPREFPNYDAGTWGPEDADALLRVDGRKWLTF